MKTDKKAILVITGTVLLAILAVFGAWRLYALRSQAIAPTAPKLVPAQEVASCPAVSFTVGGGCPVANSTCCKQPLTTCDNSLQCGTGYICYLGYCVKQTYDERTNTCPAAPAPAAPGGSGGEGDGGGAGGAPAGGAAPGASPSPSASPRPSASPSSSPSPSPSPKAAAGATSSPVSSSTQTAQTGTSTTAPSAITKAGSTVKAQEKLPEAGVSWPFTVIMGGGVLLLILGIVLAF